jgi:hypothetical protein
MEEISRLISDVTLDPALLGVIPALLVLGTILKVTPKCPDWLIAWFILFAGIAAGIFAIGLSVKGVANGMIAAGSAIGTHQLWKQTTNRK